MPLLLTRKKKTYNVSKIFKRLAGRKEGYNFKMGNGQSVLNAWSVKVKIQCHNFGHKG